MATEFKIAIPYKSDFDGIQGTRWSTTSFDSLDEIKEVVSGLEIPKDVELWKYENGKLVEESLLALEI